MAAALGLCLVLGMLPAGVRGAEVPWLYEVSVPVEDQSSSARLDAAGSALAQLLVRLTGLASVPRNEAVSRALAAPDLYYNRYAFERGPEGELELRLNFTPSAILDLVRDANLPIWRANRPAVLAWLVVDDGTERRILGADSEHPVVAGLRQRARQRGLPLQLPLLDLTDQLAVEPAAVWGRLSQSLLPASERYHADAILVGRAQSRDGERWSASWEFWVDGEVLELTLDARQPERLGRAAADMIANELAERYAVLDRGVRRLDVAVRAVEDPADYAELLRYLGGLEYVEQVNVDSVSGDRLGISLFTAAQPEQLLELFRLERRLSPDAQSSQPGGAIELVWQRR